MVEYLKALPYCNYKMKLHTFQIIDKLLKGLKLGKFIRLNLLHCDYCFSKMVSSRNDFPLLYATLQ